MEGYASLFVKLGCCIKIKRCPRSQFPKSVFRYVLQISIDPGIRDCEKYAAIAAHEDVLRTRRDRHGSCPRRRNRRFFLSFGIGGLRRLNIRPVLVLLRRPLIGCRRIDIVRTRVIVTSPENRENRAASEMVVAVPVARVYGRVMDIVEAQARRGIGI